MKTKTTDRSATRDRNSFYTTETLGKTRETTPEGFLLCRDVPIARTGQQLYTAAELPLEANAAGEIRVDRPPEEVFRDETLASFEGKPVTVEHPNEFVTPENWQRLSVGIVQNVRRGEGIEDDLLVADLLITSADAIAYVNEKLPEVSCGYDADYEQTEPGRGVQRNIVGNHVALVERGRAGPRCSIQDKEPETMKAKKRTFWDRVMTAVKARDEEAVKAELESKDSDEEMPPEGEKKPAGDGMGYDNDPMQAIAALGERMGKIEAVLAKLVPMEEAEHQTSIDEKADEEEEETKDSGDLTEAETATSNPGAVGKVLTGDSLKAVAARAEILAPGISIPTGDAIRAKGAVAALQKKALEAAYSTADGKAAIDMLLAGRTIKALTGDSLDVVFAGAAEIVRTKNNAKTANSRPSATKDFGRVSSVADINARNRAFWEARGTSR